MADLPPLPARVRSETSMPYFGALSFRDQLLAGSQVVNMAGVGSYSQLQHDAFK
jgi:hypothetical protein